LKIEEKENIIKKEELKTSKSLKFGVKTESVMN